MFFLNLRGYTCSCSRKSKILSCKELMKSSLQYTYFLTLMNRQAWRNSIPKKNCLQFISMNKRILVPKYINNNEAIIFPSDPRELTTISATYIFTATAIRQARFVYYQPLAYNPSSCMPRKPTVKIARKRPYTRASIITTLNHPRLTRRCLSM